MPIHAGREVNFAVGYQAVKNTAVNPTILLPHSGADFDHAIDYKKNEDAIGLRDRRIGQQKLREFGDGPVKGYVDRLTAEWLMRNIFGGAGVATTLSNTRTVVYAKTKAGSVPIYNTLYAKNPNVDEVFTGAVMGKLDLEIMTDSWMTYSADFISLSVEDNTTALGTVDEPILFAPQGTKLELAADTSSFGSAAEVAAKSVKIMVDPDIEAYPGINNIGYQSINSKGITVEFEIVMLFEDATQRDYWKGNNDRALRITADAEAAYGTGDVITQFQITLPRVRFDDFSSSRDIDGLVEQTIKGSAYYDFNTGVRKTMQGQIITHA